MERTLASSKSSNVVWHHSRVGRDQREQLNGHRSAVLWFTGLSGSGKSTLSNEVEERLHRMQCRTFVFDGDNVRHGLCGDLTFSEDDRAENIRRVGEVSKLFVDAGVIVLTAFISPTRAGRELVRRIVSPQDFIEIYCDCSVEVCERRDVKGLYKKARAGLISDFTGISAPYEAPMNPDISINTSTSSLQEGADRIVDMLICRGIIGGGREKLTANRY